jgi:hypothetical protein
MNHQGADNSQITAIKVVFDGAEKFGSEKFIGFESQVGSMS